MRRITAMAAALAATLALGACETTVMEPAECAVADWRALGFQDGAAGRALTRFEERASVCAQGGWAADFNLYRAGRDEGLAGFCVPERGFRLGVSGSGYEGVCPAATAAAFEEAFYAGGQIHRAQSALSSAESSLSSARSRRDAIDRKIRGNEDGLVATTDAAEQKRIRDELSRLRRERDECDDQIRDHERDIRDYARDLAAVRARFGTRYGDGYW